MKINLSLRSVTLENIDDAWEAFNSDEINGKPEGIARCAYHIARAVGVAECEASNLHLNFANSSVREYWKNLCSAPRWASFDFSLGDQISGCNGPLRDESHPYLVVARLICKTGIDQYVISLHDYGDSHGAMFEHRDVCHPFAFFDIQDPMMYASILYHINETRKDKRFNSMKRSAAEFMGAHQHLAEDAAS